MGNVNIELNLEFSISEFKSGGIRPVQGPKTELHISADTDYAGLAYVKEGLVAICDSWKNGIADIPEGGEPV